MRFTFDTALSTAWAAVKLNYGLLLGCTAVVVAIQVGLGVFYTVLNTIDPVVTQIVQGVVVVFFALALGTGVTWFGLQVVRGRKPSISAVFAGFTKYVPVTGIGLMLYVILGIGSAVVAGVIYGVGLLVHAGMSAPDSWLAELGVEALIFVLAVTVLCFIVGLRCAFAGLICLDPERSEEGVLACLGASWRATGPVYWRLLGFYLFLSLIVVVSFIALCLPLFFLGVPIALTGVGAAYHLIFTPEVEIQITDTTSV